MSAHLKAAWQKLRVPEHPARYLAIALLFDAIVTLAVTALVSLAPGQQNPTFPGTRLARIAFVMVGAVPLIETAVLAIVLEILRRFSRSALAPAFIAATLAAAAHSWAEPLWGPLVAWTFFLQAFCYLTWRARSAAAALLLTFALHALHNAVAVLVLAIQRMFTTA